MGADAAGPRSRSGCRRLEPARLGAPHRQDPPRPAAAADKPPAKQTRRHGPPVADEYLYRVVDALDEVARETGKTVPQIALNWLLQRPTVANVIIGARNEEQLRQNLGAVGWNLTPEQVAKLDAASDDRRRLTPTGTSTNSWSATRCPFRRGPQKPSSSGSTPLRCQNHLTQKNSGINPLLRKTACTQTVPSMGM